MLHTAKETEQEQIKAIAFFFPSPSLHCPSLSLFYRGESFIDFSFFNFTCVSLFYQFENPSSNLC
uniref:Uncharacterized protein n=2 Tax=Arabidopsis thaliana TaxID=3702 RepID=Q1G3A9_ARATH|nr:unknown protein [Arabidopsis thaliana]